MDKKKSVTLIASVLLAVLGAMLFISLFGKMNFTVKALQFHMSTRFSDSGITQLDIPPLGKIRAQTHSTPVKITVRLENIDIKSLKKFISDTPNQQEIVDQVRQKMRKTLRLYVIKILILAALGGAFGVFLIRYQGVIPLLKGAALGFTLAAVITAGTFYTYDEKEFQNPEYQGVLQAAPWMINFAEQALGKLETLNEKMQVVATNLYDLYEQIDRLKPLQQNSHDGVRVLHVSDLHNNPAGLEFAGRIAELFNVDIIIDTGDISDFGTPLEALLLERLDSVQKPYLFIPGNHDAPSIMDKMKDISGVQVVDGMVQYKGLNIMGFPDPVSNDNRVVPPDTQIIPNYTAEIKKKLLRVSQRIDIIAVHNHRIGRNIAGNAPVIMFGHNHKLSIEQKYNSVLVNAGTSGASGIRGLQSLKSPYSVVLLHFSKTGEKGEKMELTAADTIMLEDLKHGFVLERRVFNREKEDTAEPAP